MKAPKGSVVERLAGAPISWGVCEVPGWGIMLPRERGPVGDAGAGVESGRLGAIGYLGDDPKEIGALLASFSLGAVGGFVPVALHEPPPKRVLEQDAVRAAPSPGRVRQHLFRDRSRSRRRVVATVRTGRAPVGRVRLGAGPGGADLRGLWP